MIGSPRFARVQVGQPLVIPFDTDRPGDVAWALHASNQVAWMSFPDAAEGTCRGTAGATGGLLIVQATTADGVESTAVTVIVVPAGLHAVYAPVFAPVGAPVLAVPRAWGLVPPGRWNATDAPPGFTVDLASGAVRGPMPDGGGSVSVLLKDATDAAAKAHLMLRAQSPDTFEVLLPGTRRREGGDFEVQYVAGQTVVDIFDLPGSTGPYTAQIAAAPAWAEVADGADVRLTGTTTAGTGGLLVVDITDATGATGEFRAWVDVTRALPFQLIVPDRIFGEASELFPGELFARILGGTSPYVLAVEQAPSGIAIDSATRQITGMFPATPGVVPIRFSATDANGLVVFATMDVEAGVPVFAIMQDPITVEAGGQVSEQPTVTGGTAARWWVKAGGAAWLQVDESTGRITGTAPLGAVTTELALFAVSTLGVQATLDVRVEVTQGIVACSIPAVAAIRGTAGQVQVGVLNAPGGWTAALRTTHPWASVSAGGVVSWDALTATDTSTAAISVRVTRTADGAVADCAVTPTIANAPTTLTCSISGDDDLNPLDSAVYRVTGAGATTFALEANGGTVTALGGGRFRVLNATAEAGNIILAATVGDGTAEGTCTKTVRSGWAVSCSIPDLDTTEGTAVSGRMTGSGRPGSTLTYTSSDLPSGVTLASNGTFGGGSALASGSYSFSVTVTDSFNSRTGTCSTTLTVSKPADTPSCTTPDISFEEGGTASGSVTATGGTSPYTFIASGLPSGITMSSAGVLSGGSSVAISSGSYSVTVTDAASQTGTCSGTWEVTTAVSCPATPALAGSVGTSFSGTLPTPTGITGTLTYSRATGPSWINVQSNGRYSGTFPSSPTSGTWSYSVSGTGGSCTGAAANYTVTRPVLAASCGSASGFRGESISTTVSASGGSGGYSYALVSPPAGVTLSGMTVTLAAQSSDTTVTYRLRVTDSAGTTDDCTGTFTVSGSRLALAVAGDTGGEPGDTITGTLTGSGGSGSGYSYGSSTSGVTVSATAGTWSYVIPSGSTRGTTQSLSFHVTDSAGTRVDETWTINVEYPALELTVTGDSTQRPGRTARGQLAATGGSGTGYTFSSSTAGVTLSRGRWSYPVAAGATLGDSVTLSFTVRDSVGNETTQTWDMEFSYGALSLSGATALYPIRGRESSFQFVASGGTRNYSYVASVERGTGAPPPSVPIWRSVPFATSINLRFLAAVDGRGTYSITLTDTTTRRTASASGTWFAVDVFQLTRTAGLSLAPSSTQSIDYQVAGGLQPIRVAAGSRTFMHPVSGLRTTVSWNAAEITSGNRIRVTFVRDRVSVFDESFVSSIQLVFSDGSGQRITLHQAITLAVEN